MPSGTSRQVLYSDDHGKSYSRSGSLNSYPSSEENEFQLAELHNGSIIAVIRNVLGTHRQEVSAVVCSFCACSPTPCSVRVPLISALIAWISEPMSSTRQRTSIDD